jgi:putative PIN family toxin of toxin-antitoxin system
MVSALLVGGNPPGQVLDAWREDRFAMIISELLLGELKEVLARPKFRGRVTGEQRTAFIALLRQRGELQPDRPRASRLTVDPDDDYLAALALSAGATHLITGTGDYYPSISPDGRRVAFVRPTDAPDDYSTLWVVRVHGHHRPREVAPSVLITPVYLPKAMVWSPDGCRLAVTTQAVPGGEHGATVIVDVCHHIRRQVALKDFGFLGASFAPDGSALAVGDAVGGDERLAFIDQGAQTERLGAPGGFPMWGAGGLAYSRGEYPSNDADRPLRRDLMLRRTPTASPRVLLRRPVDQHHYVFPRLRALDWSANVRLLLAEQHGRGFSRRLRVFLIHVATGRVQRVRPMRYVAGISRNGRHILGVGKRGVIAVRPGKHGHTRVLVRHAETPTWTR